MPELEVKRQYAVHEGGTKFYQLWTVACDNIAIAVFQYGPLKSALKPEDMGGTFEVKSLTTEDAAVRTCVTKAKEKQKRGYTFGAHETYSFATTDDLSRRLTKWFGTRKAQTVLAMFATVDTAESAPTDDDENVVMGRAKPIAPATEQSLPEWGTW